MTLELKNLIRKRDIAYKEYKKLFAKNPDSNNTIHAFNNYKSLRNKVSREIPKTKKNYFSHIIDVVHERDSKSCWKNLDILSGRNATYNEPICQFEIEDKCNGELIKSIKLMYCDDTSCLVMAPDDATLEIHSNIVMKNIFNYYEGAGLKLNSKKTEIVSHASKITPSKVIVEPSSNKVQSSSRSARLLGVMIDTDFSFDTHIENILRDAKNRLRVFDKVRNVVNQRDRIIYGSSYLLSCFMYGLSIYSSAGSTLMNRVRDSYDKCIRAIYNAEKNSNVTLEYMREQLQILDFDDLNAKKEARRIIFSFKSLLFFTFQ